jgi:hypothetical protein
VTIISQPSPAATNSSVISEVEISAGPREMRSELMMWTPGAMSR